MKKKLPKVLMLGWEFPPIINGGLGIACHDLSAAMSSLAEITMIIPKSSPGFKVKDVNLVGVNSLDLKNVTGYPSNYRKVLPYHLLNVPVDLDPYYSESFGGLVGKNEFSSLHDRYNTEIFDTENLYGQNVINKVLHFADITAELARSLEFD